MKEVDRKLRLILQNYLLLLIILVNQFGIKYLWGLIFLLRPRYLMGHHLLLAVQRYYIWKVSLSFYSLNIYSNIKWRERNLLFCRPKLYDKIQFSIISVVQSKIYHLFWSLLQSYLAWKFTYKRTERPQNLGTWKGNICNKWGKLNMWCSRWYPKTISAWQR